MAKTFVSRIKEHPIIAAILLFSAIIGAVSAIALKTVAVICWLKGGGWGCSSISAQVFIPTPYYFDGSENRKVLDQLVSMSGKTVDVTLDLHFSTGLGADYLGELCDIDYSSFLMSDPKGVVHFRLFIGTLDGPSDEIIQNLENTVDCTHDFFNLVVDSREVLFESSGGGTGVGVNYIIRGKYLINVSSGVSQAQRYYSVNLK